MFHPVRALAAAAMVLALSGPAFSQQSATVRFQNDSGKGIVGLYVYDQTDSSRGVEILGGNNIASGRYLDLTKQNIRNCPYALLVLFDDGTRKEAQFDICTAGTVSIAP